ncbi:MAG TPA: AbrB/MazE/SpoVT family DNA-binding domain-containing protein [Candidatus Binatia bacterium]|nr:AbrB/MazE/SpoVT family DNA-binding domain-containing protein [Candidatus Binatia bacterium]
MKSEQIAMDKAGRVVLPRPVREELNLMPGDTLRLSIEGNGIRLEPVGEKSQFVRKGTVLVLASEFAEAITTRSVEKILATEREGRFKGAAELRRK